MRITSILCLTICCKATLNVGYTPETGLFSQFINKIVFRHNRQVNLYRKKDADSPVTIYTCVYDDKDVGDGIQITLQGVLCTRMIKDSNGLLDNKFLNMKATHDKTYLFTRLPRKVLPYQYVWPRTCYVSNDERFVDYINSIVIGESGAQIIRQKDEVSPKIVYSCDSRTTIVSGGLMVQLSGIQCEKMIKDSHGKLDNSFLTLEVDLSKGRLTAKLPGGAIAIYDDSGCPL